jgi:argininosuccinate lyase
MAEKSVKHTHEGSLGNLCNQEIATIMQQIIKKFRFEQATEAEKKLLESAQ